MKTFQHLRRTLPPLHQTFSTASHHRPPPISRLLTRTTRHHQRRPYSTPKPPYNPTPHLTSPPPSLSLSQRFRKLTREYGWSGLGVYLALSALDFPFCFAAVRYLGTDRIGRYEHVVVEWVKSVVPESVVERWREWRGSEDTVVVVGGEGYADVKDGMVAEVVGYNHGVEEAEKMNKSENASIWTQLALAYAIHKTFIFVRVPIAAAVTPKVVKTLRGWGWDIGKRKPKGPK